jgi:hypothetical protein
MTSMAAIGSSTRPIARLLLVPLELFFLCQKKFSFCSWRRNTIFLH